MQDRDAVARGAHVGLQVDEAQVRRMGEGGEGILGGFSSATTVGESPEACGRLVHHAIVAGAWIVARAWRSRDHVTAGVRSLPGD
jgi:hypothetical protein